MPYRIEIIMRSGYGQRKPHYLTATTANTTSISHLPKYDGSDIVNWDVKHEFNDSTNPENYDIHVGGISHIVAITQSPDLWGNLGGDRTHDAGEDLFDGTTNHIWHGATSNEEEFVEIEFINSVRVQSIKTWFGTYTGGNDFPGGIHVYGSNYKINGGLFEQNVSDGANAYVNVTGITHPQQGDNGQYFFFDLDQWNFAFGNVQSSTFVNQYRNGVLIKSDTVTTWNNANGIHGRWENGSLAGDWQIGDIIITNRFDGRVTLLLNGSVDNNYCLLYTSDAADE